MSNKSTSTQFVQIPTSLTVALPSKASRNQAIQILRQMREKTQQLALKKASKPGKEAAAASAANQLAHEQTDSQVQHFVPAGKIFGLTVVSRETGEEITKACRFGVVSHLKNGKRGYDADAQGLIGVFEMINRQTAVARALAELNEEIDQTRAALAAKPSRKQTKRLETKLEKKLANKSTLEKFDAEIRSLKKALRIEKGILKVRGQKNSQWASELKQLIEAKKAEEKQTGLLKAPYKSMNLLGLLQMRINGKVIKITTPPSPELKQ